MKENNFANLYKTWSTDKLLDIVDNPTEYQSLAVETARLELEGRQLTPEQISKAKAEQKLKRQDKLRKTKAINDLQAKFKSAGLSIADTLSPIQMDASNTDKIIKFISLFTGGLFLYQFYKEFGMLKFILTDHSSNWDFSVVVFFVPFLTLSTATLLFWYRKRIGWSLLTIYSSYTAVAAIPMVMMEVNRKPTGVSAIDTLFPTTSPIVYLVALLLFSGLTWTLCKESIRTIYQVDKRFMFIALGTGTGIVLLMALIFEL